MITRYLSILPLAFRADDISFSDALCDTICDDIASETMPRFLARLALTIARIFDPHCAFHAAHIRDAIRDN